MTSYRLSVAPSVSVFLFCQWVNRMQLVNVYINYPQYIDYYSDSVTVLPFSGCYRSQDVTVLRMLPFSGCYRSQDVTVLRMFIPNGSSYSVTLKVK